MEASPEPKVHQILKYSVMYQIKNLWIQHLTAGPRLCFEPSLLLERGAEHRIQRILKLGKWVGELKYAQLVLTVGSWVCINVFKVLLPRSSDGDGRCDGWDGPISVLSLYICYLTPMSSMFPLCITMRTFLFDQEGARWEERVASKRDRVRKKVGY